MANLHAPIYASRIRELVPRIISHLCEGNRVLDVGCGYGALGKALLDSPGLPKGIMIDGLEKIKRNKQLINIYEYNGVNIPFPDNTYDVVILADVLHHEPDLDRLISECIRVSCKLLIIKDHKLCGPLSQFRLQFIDWAANIPYGIPCLYQYYTTDQWICLRGRHGLNLIDETNSMNLYPPIINWIFGRKLQYMCVLGCSKFN